MSTVNLAAPMVSGLILPAPHADGFAQVGAGRVLDADVVIVGSGPGGSAAARALAEAGARVVVIEEGPPKSRFRLNYAHTARYHMQEAGAMTARGDTYFPVAAGRGVGGGSLINSALCFRAPERVLQEWEQVLEDPAWGPASFHPIYDELAAILGIGPARPENAGENNRLIARGALALGYPGGLAPRNTPDCKGCGACNFGCPTNGKATVNLTLLPRAVDRGALIQADTKIEEVIVEKGRAVGVRGRAWDPDTGEAGGTVEVRARRVVLSAGAIGTPRLLWSCGLAAGLGRVGEELHIHPGGAVLGICDEPIYLWRGATQGAWFEVPDEPGSLPHAFTAPPEVVLAALGYIGPRLEEGLRVLPHLCGVISLLSDTGAGQVRAHADGRADVSYKLHPLDLARAKTSMRTVARVLLAGGAKKILAPVRGVGVHESAESFAAALAQTTWQDFSMYTAHPMSTCRIGLDAAQSPVGPDGQFHKLPGLFVADASVFPTSLGVNPQYTTMAAATLIARKMVATGWI